MAINPAFTQNTVIRASDILEENLQIKKSSSLGCAFSLKKFQKSIARECFLVSQILTNQDDDSGLILQLGQLNKHV